MLFPVLLLAAAFAQAPQAPQASPAPPPRTPSVAPVGQAGSAPRSAATDSLFPPPGDVIRLFTDCDEARWPYGIEERYVPKTTGEIDSGIVRRRALEAGWRAYFAARAGDSIRPTPKTAWRFPLAQRGRLLNNFLNPRAEGPHEALDIFVQREGVEIRTPAAGVIVASGDGWKGGWERRGRGFYYEGDGLSRRSGNGGLLFDVESGGYFLFSHLQEGIRVRTGDVLPAGAPIGRVGHTGNAVQPGRGRHLHLAYKEPGMACGIEGVLVPVNPFRSIRAARDREYLPSATPAGSPAPTP
ncbi:MAG: M23 family metallopeptidase [Gemmatimonadota bacterium]